MPGAPVVPALDPVRMIEPPAPISGSACCTVKMVAFTGGFSCGLDATLRIISGKWKPLLLFFPRDGPRRYGELQRLVQGVSHKVLIQTLKDLEADHVLLRTDDQEVPPRVDYALTPLGRSLADAIVPLCTWGTEHME